MIEFEIKSRKLNTGKPAYPARRSLFRKEGPRRAFPYTMKPNRNIALSAAIVLAFALTTPAEAQFGKLIKKVKKNAERVVENKVESSAHNAVVNGMYQTEKAATKAVKNSTKKIKDKAAGKVGEKTGLPVSSASGNGNGKGSSLETLYLQNFKPSAGALEADPDASNDDVWRRSTRSFAQIHAAYEHLDPKYFPLQPYYKYPRMYGLGDDILIGHHVLDDMLREVLSQRPGTSVYFPPFIYDEKNEPELLTPAGEKMGIYRDDAFRYPFAAAFFADPNSDIAVQKLAELLVCLSPIMKSGMEIKPETCNDYKGILDANLGIVLPAMEYEKLRFARERIMFNMALNVVDFDLIADRVIDCFNKVEANDAFCQKDPSLRAKYYLMGTELYTQILVQHKDWNEREASDPKARKATMLYTRWTADGVVGKIMGAVRMGNVPAVPMPKGVSVSGELKAKGDAAGRELAGHRGDEFVKVVYHSGKWQEIKEKVWPYKTIKYTIKADLITRSGGKTVLTHCYLQKSANGQKYVMVVGSDPERHPVK